MFNPLTAHEIAIIVSEGLVGLSPTIVDLGNQTFGVDDLAMERIERLLSRTPPERGVDVTALRALRGQRRGTKARHAGGAPLTADFYRALGFSRYEAIDINSRFGSHVMDLNKDLDRDYGFSRQYDLVVNTGTSEHVFNQAAFLRNAHHLAAPGGLMLHVVPFTGYTNHGFYNYQPGLFYDLAAANAYDVVRVRLADRDQELLDLNVPSDLAAHFGSFLGLATPNERNNTFLVALLRRSGHEEFVFPCQGRYLQVLEGAPRQEYLGRQTGNGRPALLSPGAPADGEAYGTRLRRRIKRALLKSLRSASRTVLLRL
ncbi:MAG: methyltransferase domain-containing protein [Candidatus Polarisedimenticolia bacterium]